MSVLMVCGLLVAPVHALTLRELLDASSLSHPSVLAAKFGANAAQDSIEVAKRQNWPTLSAQADGGIGGSRLLRVQQTLWNGRFTEASIKSSEIGLDMALLNQELQQQKLALQVGAAWQALWSAQGRLRVADSMQRQLRRFEEMMRRRVQAELSVGVELDLVRARLLQSRVDSSRAQADIRSSIERLERLTGCGGLLGSIGALPVGQTVDAFGPSIERLQLVMVQMQELIARQPEVRLAREEVRFALQQIALRKSQALPQVYVRLDQYVSGSRPTSAYFGVSYTTGAGFAAPLEVEALSKRAQGAEQSAQAAELEIQQSLVLDMSELLSAQQRLSALSRAVEGAGNVLDSYERQFVANRKSWQDLLNAVREVGQNETARVEAESQLVGAILRIQLRADSGAIDASIGVGSGPADKTVRQPAGLESHGN